MWQWCSETLNFADLKKSFEQEKPNQDSVVIQEKSRIVIPGINGRYINNLQQKEIFVRC